MRSGLMETRPVPGRDNNRQSPLYGSPSSPTPRSTARPARSISLVPIEGWLPLVLLTIAVYCVVYSVTAAIAVNHTPVLWITTAVGLLGGFCVSKSRFLPQAAMHICACIVGYWAALCLTSILAFHVPVGELLSALRTLIFDGFALGGTPDSDMVFLFYLSFLCFFLGYFGSWLIYRAHLPWLVALVYVSIMLVNLNYISKGDLSALMVVLVGALLLLIVRIQLAGKVTQWKSDGLYTDRTWMRSITARFLQIATLFLVLILPLSWLLPMISQPSSGVAFWNKLDTAWSNLAHGNMSALSNPGTLFNPYTPPANFFSDQLDISGSVSLPDGPVLTYTSAQPQYLEGFTYDTFDGHVHWSSDTVTNRQFYAANSSLPLDYPGNATNQLTLGVTILQPPDGTQHYIFGPPQPSHFDVDVATFSDPQGQITSAWAQTSPLAKNEKYTVTSEVSSASPGDLSNVPLPQDNSAFWENNDGFRAVAAYNLQIPNSLSPEVHATAQTWTAGATNAYAAIADLQQHLSNTAAFTYSTINDPIPADRDIVTWLLHTHKGYCTYYASAMVMMARQLGIPARMVNGFSQGRYDAQQNAWIVQGSDAHSWVQVYFPTFGWVNFDPTPTFSNNGSTITPAATVTPGITPTPTKPAATSTPGSKQPTTNPTVRPTQQHNGQPATHDPSTREKSAGSDLFLAFSLLILFGSVIVLALAIMRYRSRRLGRFTVSLVYRRLCRLTSLIGIPPALWQTPYEYTFALSQKFPQASTALHRLADLFVRERWASPQQSSQAYSEHDLEQLWQRVRNVLLRASLFKKR